MFKQIFQFLVNNPWILIPIGLGVFNGSIRLKQKLDEQRVKRDALNQMALRQKESLRTGRSGTPVQGKKVQPFSDLTNQQPVSSEELRKQRIEELRQERVDQLRALREKRAADATTRAGVVATSSSMVPTKPQPTARRAGQPSPATNPSGIVRSKSGKLKTPTQSASQRSRVLGQQLQQKQQTRGRQQVKTKPNRRTVVATPPVSTQNQSSRTVSRKQPLDAYAKKPKHAIKGNTQSTQTDVSVRSMLRNKNTIRQAILIREIMDTPVGLRENEISSGSLFS
ncbi:MAG: hypothetical protein P1U42_00245 [Phycisphaerales bacterium]|nr:hypothetical protein [Phycisphaerales bacterium]